MNFHCFETFCTLVDTGSFSATAQKLSLSQPAVSQHVKAVERLFGGQLLDRSTSPPALTPLGARVLPHIRLCILSLQAALQDAGNGIDREENRLRIGAGFSIGDYIVPMLLTEFRRVHPDYSVSVHVNKNQEILKQVMAHGCDAAITVIPRSTPGYQQFVLFPLLDEELVLTVPPDHPLVRAEEISLKGLAPYPLIRREPGSPTRQTVDEALRKAGELSPRQDVMEMASQESMKQAIRAGLGVGFMPLLSLKEDLAAGRLATVRVRGLRIIRQLHVVYLKSSPVPSSLSTFLAFAQGLKHRRWPQFQAAPSGQDRSGSSASGPGAPGTMRSARSSRITDS